MPEEHETEVIWGFTFRKVFCAACDKFEQHIQTLTGDWECLGCCVKDLPLDIRFPHLFKD